VDTSRAGRAGSLVAALVAVSVLLAAVAAASRPEDAAAAPTLGEAPFRLLLDAASVLLLLAAGLGLGLIVWAFWPRPEEDRPALPPRRRRSAAAMAVSAALFVVLAVWLRGRGVLRLPAVGPAGPAAPGGGPATAGPAPGPGGPGAGLEWLAVAAVLVLGLAAVLVVAWLLRPRRPAAPGATLAGIRQVLEDAIEDVLAETDPRRAVIAAWARLERVLAGHGLPRREAEAPAEYAARADAELAGGAVPLGRLADLFEWARFSLHDVTPAMREEALGGLRAVRDGLRDVA
jgi:Domain of unknown function (DUF4129)